MGNVPYKKQHEAGNFKKTKDKPFIHSSVCSLTQQTSTELSVYCVLDMFPCRQWYASKCLITSSPEKKSWFIAFANLCGINTPTMADRSDCKEQYVFLLPLLVFFRGRGQPAELSFSCSSPPPPSTWSVCRGCGAQSPGSMHSSVGGSPRCRQVCYREARFCCLACWLLLCSRSGEQRRQDSGGEFVQPSSGQFSYNVLFLLCCCSWSFFPLLCAELSFLSAARPVWTSGSSRQ